MLTIEKNPTNEDKFIVRGDHSVYGVIMNGLGAKYYKRLKGPPGWNVPMRAMEQVKKLISEVEKSDAELGYADAEQERRDNERSVTEQEVASDNEVEAESDKEDAYTDDDSTSSDTSINEEDALEAFYKSFKVKPDIIPEKEYYSSEYSEEDISVEDDIDEIFSILRDVVERLEVLEKKLGLK